MTPFDYTDTGVISNYWDILHQVSTVVDTVVSNISQAHLELLRMPHFTWLTHWCHFFLRYCAALVTVTGRCSSEDDSEAM